MRTFVGVTKGQSESLQTVINGVLTESRTCSDVDMAKGRMSVRRHKTDVRFTVPAYPHREQPIDWHSTLQVKPRKAKFCPRRRLVYKNVLPMLAEASL
jgi:hypothetical protein